MSNKLYHHPLSPYCRKVTLALHEKGVTNVEHVVVNLMDPQAKAKFTEEHNPLGKVPFLVLEDGWKIPESSIIIEWIDQHSDGRKLIPSDPDKARQARFFDRVSDLYLLEPAARNAIEPWLPEEMRSAQRVEANNQTILKALKAHESGASKAKTDFILGDEFTFADISVTSALGVIKDLKISLNDFPTLAAYAERVHSRPSWQAWYKGAKPFIEKMQSGA